jgi:hypothetical protein
MMELQLSLKLAPIIYSITARARCGRHRVGLGQEIRPTGSNKSRVTVCPGVFRPYFLYEVDLWIKDSFFVFHLGHNLSLERQTLRERDNDYSIDEGARR